MRLLLASMGVMRLLHGTSAVPVPPDPVSIEYPAVNGEVYSICVVKEAFEDGVVYIGGDFTEVGGIPRNHAAAFDLATGTLTGWNPDVDGAVHAIAISNGEILLGGSFATVGGEARANLAAVAVKSGSAKDWKPDPDGSVLAITATTTTLFIGGDFANIDSGARSRLAAFAASNHALLPWNPGADGMVRTLLVTGTTLYAGGDFQNVGGSARPFAAAFNISTGDLTGWSPVFDGAVRAFTVHGTSVLTGGDFNTIGGIARPFLAAIDGTTGIAADWSLDVNGPVRSLDTIDRILYLAGDFTAVSGVARSRVASVNLKKAALLAWNPGANGTVNAIRIAGRSSVGRYEDDRAVLLGGAFTNVGNREVPAFTGLRDKLLSGHPSCEITKVGGRLDDIRRRYYTHRKRLRLVGRASSTAGVVKATVVVNPGSRTFIVHGTTKWRATVRLRVGLNRMNPRCVDSLGRTGGASPLSEFGDLVVIRLRPGEKPPWR